MTVIKKFTAVIIDRGDEYSDVTVNLSLGRPSRFSDYKKQIHDTEEEAIEYAFSEDRFAKWLILPIISFDFD